MSCLVHLNIVFFFSAYAKKLPQNSRNASSANVLLIFFFFFFFDKIIAKLVLEKFSAKLKV